MSVLSAVLIFSAFLSASAETFSGVATDYINSVIDDSINNRRLLNDADTEISRLKNELASLTAKNNDLKDALRDYETRLSGACFMQANDEMIKVKNFNDDSLADIVVGNRFIEILRTKINNKCSLYESE